MQKFPNEKARPVIMKKTKKEIGDLGEKVASEFLMKHGIRVTERNYLKKWGEIDIIAKKESTIHFIEVKTVIVRPVIHETVTYETKLRRNKRIMDYYRPEDNVDSRKMKKISKVIQTYLFERGFGDEVQWQFDLITVRLDMEIRLARVHFYQNLIL
jgi:putative endonuclease